MADLAQAKGVLVYGNLLGIDGTRLSALEEKGVI